MVTENMKAFAVIFVGRYKAIQGEQPIFSDTFHLMLAIADTQEVCQLTEAEIVEVKRLAREGRLAELAE